VRRGLGTLLIATLAVMMFASPNLAPPGFHAATTGSATSVGQPRMRAQQRAVNRSSNVICSVDNDPTCATCPNICPADDFIATTRAFFGPRDKNEPSAAPRKHVLSDAEYEIDLRKHWGVASRARKELQFIVAIVPDPVHTHLSLFFDRQVDAIEEAAQEQGYLFARASMPWDLKSHSEALDLESRILQDRYTRAREGLPGLMIFRKATPRGDAEFHESLFVFFVGETPTGGIDKQQFHNALRAIQDIQGDSTSSLLGEPLRILGPTFSGSLYSLMVELGKKQVTPFSDILVHSGTASSWDTIQWFQSYCCRPSNLEFVTFHESDCYMLARLARFAEVRGYAQDNVALLSEDETAYGNQGRTKSEDLLAHLEPCKETIGATTLEAKTVNPSPCEYSKQVVHLYFPREISQLRGAYQRDVQDASADNSSENRLPRSTLRVNLEDTGTDDDSVPPYSTVQTPLSQEAVLLGIVSNLRKHHVDFVVVQATSPLDTLFLCRYLRVAYPEGRIVTIGSDLLFQQEVDDPRLQGILALSPYPLLPGIDDEIAISPYSVSEIHRDRVFPAGYSVGTYNAMLSLLESRKPSHATSSQQHHPEICDPDLGRQGSSDHKCDLPDAGFVEYGWPSIAGMVPDGRSALAPPLWLTVLGRYGYWPLAVLDSEPFAAPQSPLLSNIHAVDGPEELHIFKPRVPLAWKVLCCSCIFVVIGYLFLLWRGSFTSSSESMANFAPVAHSVRSSVLFIAGLLLVIMVTSLISPAVRWYSSPEFLALGLVLGFFLIALALLCSGDLLVRGARKRAGAFLVFSFAISLLPLLWWLAAASTANLDLYRYIHITAGISPLMPFLLLLAACFWWIWYSLAGLALQDSRAPQLPRLQDLGVVMGTGEMIRPELSRFLALSDETNADLMEALKPLSLVRDVYRVPFIAIMMFVLISLPSLRPVQSLEGIWFDRFYALALTFVVFVLLSSLFRLTIIWMKFRDLLLALDRLPLRRGFARLTGFAWKPMWRLGGGAIGDYLRLFSREFESLMYLKSLLTSEDTQLMEAIERVEDLRKDLSNHILQNRPASEDTAPQLETSPSKSWLDRLCIALRYRRMGDDADRIDYLMDKVEALQIEIASTAGAALQYLIVRWPNDLQAPLFEVPDTSKGKCHLEEVDESKETKQAEQFTCLVFLNFILTVLLRIRVLVMTVAGLFVFALLSFGSYPFEPRASFHSIMVVLFFVAVGMVSFVFAQMHRDTTLSHITDTTPGELGLDFWLRLASFVAVPLLSLLAVQFPQVNSILSSWMQPALQAFK
jgi:hypothetical protein